MCNPAVDVICLGLFMVVKVVFVRKREIYLVNGFWQHFFSSFSGCIFPQFGGLGDELWRGNVVNNQQSILSSIWIWKKNWIPLSLVCNSGSHIKIGIFEKCSACLSFLFVTLRLVYTRWQVAAICHTASSQQQIALCVLENFYENLCLCNRISSQQHVTKNQIIQFVQLVGAIKFCCRDSTDKAICRCDVPLQSVAATSHPTWTHRVICSHNLSLQLVT